MTAILIFIAFMVGMVAFAVIRAKISGVRALMLEDWKPDEGETVIFEDRKVRLLLTHRMGRADERPGAFVVVTNRRLLAGQRPLFGGGSMVTHMLYAGRARGTDADSIGGGLFRRGYQTLVAELEAVERMVEARKPYVELKLAASAVSSFNLEAFRIYTDRAAEFPWPPDR